MDGYNFYYWNCIMLIIYRLLIKDRKKFLFVACFQLFLVLAFRSTEVGIDAWFQYPKVYIESSQMTFEELISGWSFIHQRRIVTAGGENGYIAINWIIGHLLGLPYRAVIIFLALIAAAAFYKYLKRNAYSPLLAALAVYVFQIQGVAYLSAIRRSTAHTFVLLAVVAMEERKIKKAALILFLAMTMHRSSMIMFLFLPFVNVKITREFFRKVVIMIILSGLSAMWLAQHILPVILNALGKAGYFYGKGGTLIAMSGLEIKAIFGMGLLWFIYRFVDFDMLNTSYNNMLCKLFLFVIIFSPIQMVVPLIDQIYQYFTMPSMIFISNIAVQMKASKSIKCLMWVMVFLVLTFVLVRNTERQRPYGNGTPSGYYKTMWTSRYGD